MSGSNEQPAYALAITTLDNEESAKKMARAVIASGLAACAQISPIRSFYQWEGEAREEEEFRIDMKIRLKDYPALEQEILQQHPYETPEILCIPIKHGFAPYLTWIDQAACRKK